MHELIHLAEQRKENPIELQFSVYFHPFFSHFSFFPLARHVNQGEMSIYANQNTYECLACAEGCDSCKDASPCVAELNWPMRTIILALACAVIGLLPPAAWFTFRYQHVKVRKGKLKEKKNRNSFIRYTTSERKANNNKSAQKKKEN